jgi:integrase
MARAKIPAWQPFKFDPRKDESGRWTARSKYNDDAGMRHEIKRSGRTKGAADLALRRAIEDAKVRSKQRAEEAEKAEAAVLTLKDLAGRWLEVRKPAPIKIDEKTQTGAPPTRQLRMQTWVSYENNLRNHVLPALGESAVAQLKTPDFESAIHGLYDKKAGTGYRTAEMAKQVLSQIMDYAVRQGHRLDNPVRFVSKVPTPYKAPVRLKRETLVAVQEAVEARQPEPGIGGPKPTSRLSDVVLLLRGTGLRIGEALGVRWDDVHIRGDAIFLTVSGTLVEKGGAFYRQSYPKSRDSHRTLPLNNVWLQDMIRRRYANRKQTRTNAVFPTRNGTFVRLSNFRSDFSKATSAVPVREKITPHSFRSTVGSEIAERHSDEAAQKQLGHSSPETTRRYYIHRPDVVEDYSSGIELTPPLDEEN